MARGIQDARYKRLIEALAAARHNAGISQTELAKRLGTRQQFVSKYESGERRLDFVEVLDIAKALGMPVETLLAI
jgi:transcriptional regulator with XRE-family HTH domain